MRLLALSDIHHNLLAVRKLRASEKNSFDAIIVAGDIGSKSASEFFKILSTFKCPTLYVYGNWDHELTYKLSFGPNCHLIHSNVVQVGKLSFTGFSGCPTNWGMNPIYRKFRRRIEADNVDIIAALKNDAVSPDKIKRTKAYREYVAQRQLANSEVLRLNRQGISDAMRKEGADPQKSTIITHQRLSRLSQEFPGTLLHIFGHIHKYSDHVFRGTRYINVAALDRSDPDVGNYATVEIDSSLEVKAKCIALPQ
jgi:Icc-related predicted phosphoesterase